MALNAKSSGFFEEYATSIESGVKNQSINRSLDFYPYIKRSIDLFITIFASPLAIILIAIFAILIKLETPGPAFFLQERVGQNGKYFKVIKLRSMGVNAEKNGAQWAIANDPRVTKIGSFIRKTRIDELPQLLNILKGEMSIVGPRPERPIFTAQFNEEIPGFVNRLVVKPGLTGLAQVNGGYELSPKEKLDKDLNYIRNKNTFLDIKIILKTIKVCVKGDGAR
jgi:lipopolysaccharide/colanic/teichoic acid biosynthesis glycosyltransferase